MADLTIIDEEYTFNGDVIISQTDTNGIITYANRAFCRISDYSVNELVGQAHSIIRHPNMPKVVFTKLWKTISDAQAWNGLIKNRRKDGKFYWVDTEILPVLNENKEITGFIAVQKEASRKDIHETQDTYNKMLETQD